MGRRWKVAREAADAIDDGAKERNDEMFLYELRLSIE